MGRLGFSFASFVQYVQYQTMGKRTGYNYISDEKEHIYRFTSKGPKGDIPKIAVMSPAFRTAWYLAFGDAIGDEGDFDDEVVTNNGDMKMVLLTLANIVSDFLAKQPDAEVIINPVDEKRKQLYNRIIQRNFDELSKELFIFGVIGKVKTPLEFSPITIYEAFTVLKKTTNFDKKSSK
ncbi:MAG: hypothetical protein IT258_15335 [Saprospiraceae bacterium]|nr:hypothetical protein [Saprospiraceae bacterium]